jgi:hypothetical protein
MSVAAKRPLPQVLLTLSIWLHLIVVVLHFACVSFWLVLAFLNAVPPRCSFEDNETCQKMTDSLVASPRMQHLGARYHWLREQVVHDKTLRLVYCNTPDQIADCLTKPPPGRTSYCPIPRCSICYLVILPLGTLL